MEEAFIARRLALGSFPAITLEKWTKAEEILHAKEVEAPDRD